MRALDIKLFRDLRRLWAQAVAIALVVAGGAAALVAVVGSIRSLQETRAAYYERNQFADIFAQVKRAPKKLIDQIAEIPGVAAVEARVTKFALLDIPDSREPVTAQFISIPDDSEQRLNRIYIRSGRVPEPGRAEEVVVYEAFADAHKMPLGSRFFGDTQWAQARARHRRHGAVARIHLYDSSRRDDHGQSPLRHHLDVGEGACQRLQSRRGILVGYAQAPAQCIGARGDQAAGRAA